MKSGKIGGSALLPEVNMYSKAVAKPEEKALDTAKATWNALYHGYSQTVKLSGDSLLSLDQKVPLKLFLNKLGQSGSGLMALPEGRGMAKIMTRLWTLLIQAKKRVVLIAPEDTVKSLLFTYQASQIEDFYHIKIGVYTQDSQTVGDVTLFSEARFCHEMSLKHPKKPLNRELFPLLDPSEGDVAMILYGLHYTASEALLRLIPEFRGRMIAALDDINPDKPISMPLEPLVVIEVPKTPGFF